MVHPVKALRPWAVVGNKLVLSSATFFLFIKHCLRSNLDRVLMVWIVLIVLIVVVCGSTKVHSIFWSHLDHVTIFGPGIDCEVMMVCHASISIKHYIFPNRPQSFGQFWDPFWGSPEGPIFETEFETKPFGRNLRPNP